jgi:hypothetical protein
MGALSVSTVHTNYKGISPVREVEPERITHFSENICSDIRYDYKEQAEFAIWNVSTLLVRCGLKTIISLLLQGMQSETVRIHLCQIPLWVVSKNVSGDGKAFRRF